MRITYHLDDGNDKITNFKIAEAIIDLCNDEHETCRELNAETVAKMILLQIDAVKEGADNG
jgi:hypothetical protein